MMSKETLTPTMVKEVVNEFIGVWNEETEDDVETVIESQISFDLIKEMNADITGSQQSNVPEIIWDVLSEEGLVPDNDDMGERFQTWYEENHS